MVTKFPADWCSFLAAAGIAATAHMRELREADVPTPDEAQAFEVRCRSVTAVELGDILWHARSPHYARIAERVLAERLATCDLDAH